jgi:hypothetical protein
MKATSPNRVAFGTLAILLLCMLLAGCQPAVERAQGIQNVTYGLSQGDILGQTFTSRFDGLGAIGVVIQDAPANPGTVVLNLFDNAAQETLLRQVELPTDSISQPGLTYFYFPPVAGSSREDYFFSLQWKGKGSISLGSANGESYQDGSLYANGVPQDAQLSFDLIYGRRLMLAGLLQEFARSLAYLLVAAFLWIVPGWGFLSILYARWETLGTWAKIGLSGGVSLAFYPILMLWTDLIGVHLGAAYAWLPPLAGMVAILYRNYKKLTITNLRQARFHAPTWPAIAMFFVVTALIAVRLWAIRDLPVPLWGDSYQHTVIAQLLVDHGGLFTNWQPFAEMESFTYHFGFHSQVAAFHWITRLPITASVLLAGQMINILSVISLVPLAQRINRNPWSGVFTMLLAGMVMTMPMVYLNWGRYTQLTGLTLLAAWVYLAWDYFDAGKIRWPAITLTAVTLAGLALTHYRVLIFGIVFLVAYALLNVRLKQIGMYLKQVLWMSLPAIILVAPWYWHAVSSRMAFIFSRQMTTPPSQRSAAFMDANAIGNIFNYLPTWICLLLPVLIGIALWHRKKEIAILSLWWYLIFLAANPQWFDLPGMGVLTSFAVMISLYVPASLILGSSAAWFMDYLQTKAQSVPSRSARWLQVGAPIALCVSVILVALIGIPARAQDIDPVQNTLVTQADIRAARWIDQNLPEQAHFLVNSFFAYNNTSIVGSDGGWWLPILANRQTNLPPLPYVSEKGAWPEYRVWVNSLVADIQEKGITNPDVLADLSERGLEYIYIGQKQGSVNSPEPLLELDTLLSDPRFVPVYQQDRVWIFQIVDQPSP